MSARRASHVLRQDPMSALASRSAPRRVLRVEGPVFAVVLLASVIGIGTVGFHFIEGWNLWRAFYVTVLGVATVNLPPLTHAGQLFSLFVLFGGVGTALYTFTRLATVAVEGTLPRQLQRRRLTRMLDTITNHFIICGYGRIGSTVARQFQRQRVPCVVIERDPARLQAALEAGLLGVVADSGSEEVLVRVGIARARGLVAAVGTDAENVYTVLSARVLRPDLFIVGRAETDDATLKLKRAGADRVISPYQIGAVQMAQTALRPAVVDFVELATSSENLELAIEEVSIGADSPLVGQSILSSNLRQRLGVIVVGIQRQDRSMEFNPSPETRIHAGDKLVVLGRPDSFRRLESEAVR
jgi:voltage-gated potassium channel